MTLLICLIVAVAAFAAGFFLATLRTQREAISAKAQLKAEQQHADENMRRQAQALRAEFKAMSVEMMRTQGDALRQQHLHSLESLLKPLGHNIEDFRTQFVKDHATLDSYIKALVEQTTTLGKEADALAKALKGNTKLQGNWGEAVLANLLCAAGLTEGRDYTLQEHHADGRGSVAIPDVVVHLPEDRNLIIDSKVSLKAFTEYVAADDAIEQDRLLKEHVRSVRQHIKELSVKNYNKVVPNSIGYVLMFIPGEAAYVAAVTADPTFTQTTILMPTCSRQTLVKGHAILVKPAYYLKSLYGVRGFCVCDVSVVQGLCTIK